MKVKKLNECVRGEKVKVYLMINRITDKRDGLLWAYCKDKYKEIQCIISCDKEILKLGDVILAKGNYSEPFKIDSIEIINDYNVEDFLQVCKRSIIAHFINFTYVMKFCSKYGNFLISSIIIISQNLT